MDSSEAQGQQLPNVLDIIHELRTKDREKREKEQAENENERKRKADEQLANESTKKPNTRIRKPTSKKEGVTEMLNETKKRELNKARRFFAPTSSRMSKQQRTNVTAQFTDFLNARTAGIPEEEAGLESFRDRIMREDSDEGDDPSFVEPTEDARESPNEEEQNQMEPELSRNSSKTTKAPKAAPSAKPRAKPKPKDGRKTINPKSRSEKEKLINKQTNAYNYALTNGEKFGIYLEDDGPAVYLGDAMHHGKDTEYVKRALMYAIQRTAPTDKSGWSEEVQDLLRTYADALPNPDMRLRQSIPFGGSPEIPPEGDPLDIGYEDPMANIPMGLTPEELAALPTREASSGVRKQRSNKDLQKEWSEVLKTNKLYTPQDKKPRTEQMGYLQELGTATKTRKSRKLLDDQHRVPDDSPLLQQEFSDKEVLNMCFSWKDGVTSWQKHEAMPRYFTVRGHLTKHGRPIALADIEDEEKHDLPDDQRRWTQKALSWNFDNPAGHLNKSRAPRLVTSHGISREYKNRKSEATPVKTEGPKAGELRPREGRNQIKKQEEEISRYGEYLKNVEEGFRRKELSTQRQIRTLKAAQSQENIHAPKTVQRRFDIQQQMLEATSEQVDLLENRLSYLSLEHRKDYHEEEYWKDKSIERRSEPLEPLDLQGQDPNRSPPLRSAVSNIDLCDNDLDYVPSEAAYDEDYIPSDTESDTWPDQDYWDSPAHMAKAGQERTSVMNGHVTGAPEHNLGPTPLFWYAECDENGQPESFCKLPHARGYYLGYKNKRKRVVYEHPELLDRPIRDWRRRHPTAIVSDEEPVIVTKASVSSVPRHTLATIKKEPLDDTAEADDDAGSISDASDTEYVIRDEWPVRFEQDDIDTSEDDVSSDEGAPLPPPDEPDAGEHSPSSSD
ncbi:MAG: hypothetical protein Q9227_003705 [Pyrenula ochraceoflavens]